MNTEASNSLPAPTCAAKYGTCLKERRRGAEVLLPVAEALEAYITNVSPMATAPRGMLLPLPCSRCTLARRYKKQAAPACRDVVLSMHPPEESKKSQWTHSSVPPSASSSGTVGKSRVIRPVMRLSENLRYRTRQCQFLFTSQHEVGNALSDGTVECVHRLLA